MGAARKFSGLVVGTLVSATLSVAYGGSSSADAGSPSPRGAIASPSGQVVAAPAAQSLRAVRSYWTVERMEAAVPIEEVVPGLGGSTTYDVRDSARERTAAPVVRAPRTTGKLFFSDGPDDYVCSAATIKSRKRNQVITAGHCVHTGPHVPLLQQPRFYSNWLFVPRYRDGRAPFGRWVGANAWVFKGWVEREAYRFDQAIISFKRRNNRRLVDVVGGNEVVWGEGPRQWGVRIWGWPAEDPFDGRTARRCDGPTARFEDTGDAAMRECALNGGASGGPWFLPRGRTANTGRIWAITSRRLLDRPVLLAYPIPGDMRRMIRAANR